MVVCLFCCSMESGLERAGVSVGRTTQKPVAVAM